MRWIAPVPRQRSGLEGNRERVPSAKKKAPAKRGEGWYPECGLKESESTTVPCHTDLQIAKFLLWNSLGFTITVGSAVSPYRSKFADCMAGAVPNSYPKLDLLWDNVIAGPWGWLRSTVLAQVPARHPPCDGSGRLRYAKRAYFHLRNATRCWHG